MKNLFRYFLVITVAAAAAAGQSTTPAPSDAKAAQPAPRKVDRAAAYYHYAVAHMYEEQVTVYGRSELANKAMEEYRLAIEADPSSEFLTSGLAELYVKTGRIRDAVIEAQDIIKRDPTNLEAHKLLGRIYLRSLGDMPGGSGSDNVLKLAIEQYEQIVKIEPDQRRRSSSARPPLSPEQRFAESRERTQDRDQARPEFRRSSYHPRHALHR